MNSDEKANDASDGKRKISNTGGAFIGNKRVDASKDNAPEPLVSYVIIGKDKKRKMSKDMMSIDPNTHIGMNTGLDIGMGMSTCANTDPGMYTGVNNELVSTPAPALGLEQTQTKSGYMQRAAETNTGIDIGTGTDRGICMGMGMGTIIQHIPNRASKHSPTDTQRTPDRNTGSGGPVTEIPNELSPRSAEKTQKGRETMGGMKEDELESMETIGGMEEDELENMEWVKETEKTAETEETGQMMNEKDVDPGTVNAPGDKETEEIYCRSKKGGVIIRYTCCGTECLFNIGNEFRTVFLNPPILEGVWSWSMIIKCDKDGRGFAVGAAPRDSLCNFADKRLSGNGACSFCLGLGKNDCVWVGLNGVGGKAEPWNSRLKPKDEMIVVEVVADATARKLSLRICEKTHFVIVGVEYPLRLGVTGSGEASFNSLFLRHLEKAPQSYFGRIHHSRCPE